ncbi:MAG: polysaccharide biosynthesis tyrosine autokinase [bacterium]
MNQNKEIHLLDYVHLIRKRKWIVIACVFITVITVIIGNYTVVPVYQTTCQLIFDKEASRSPITGEDIDYLYYEAAFSEEIRFNTQTKIITSYAVLEDVIKRLKLKDRDQNKSEDSFLKASIMENIRTIKALLKDYMGEKEQVQDDVPATFSDDLPDLEMASMVDSLRSQIKVEPVVDTRLINITVTDESPKWAAIIANALGKAYIDYDQSYKYKSVRDFMNWISEQITEMKQKVDESEKEFFDYKNESKVFSIETKQGINTQKIAELNDAYIKSRAERIEIKARIFHFENLLKKKKDKIIGRDIIDNPILEALHKDYIEAQIELDNLQLRYKSKHPKIVTIKNRIKTLGEELDNALQKSLKGLYMQDKIVQSREDSIKSAIAKQEEDAFETNKKEIRYSMLEREVETNKTLYDILFAKLKETKINESMKNSNIRFTEPATVPASPIKPKKKLNIILGFILGLMSGVGLIFLMEYMETGIKTEDDVKHYLELPVLGLIPEDETDREGKKRRKKKNGTYPLVTDKVSPTFFSEAFLSMRTNITYSVNGSPCKTILVTSSMPEEGKSTTVMNLGLTFSQAGNRVLILDADLRKPSLFESFNLDREKGLTNILVNTFNSEINSGTLEEYGIGDIMTLLKIQDRSGILQISDHSDQFQLYFSGGILTDVHWKNRPEEQKLGSILVGSGKITEEQRMRALGQQENYKARLGTILLNTNMITHADLRGPLTLHFSSVMNRIAAMKHGDFMFTNSLYYTQRSDGLDYSKESFLAWQEAMSNQNTPFLRASILSFIQDSPQENLRVLTSGPLHPNPSELLSSRRMKAVMNIVKKKFDYIIIDSPPVNSVTDTSILISLVDGVIHVIAAGRTNRHSVMKADQHLKSIGAKIYGVALNRLNFKEDGYYYYYSNKYFNHHE